MWGWVWNLSQATHLKKLDEYWVRRQMMIDCNLPLTSLPATPGLLKPLWLATEIPSQILPLFNQGLHTRDTWLKPMPRRVLFVQHSVYETPACKCLWVSRHSPVPQNLHCSPLCHTSRLQKCVLPPWSLKTSEFTIFALGLKCNFSSC